MLILIITTIFLILIKIPKSNPQAPPERLELPPNAKETYIIFLSGLDTRCDDTPYKRMGFEYFRSQFNRVGLAYSDEHFLMYSYTGGKVLAGRWCPNSYDPLDTGQPIEFSVMRLKNMIDEFTLYHPQARYLLVGHSLGGRIAFDYAARYHLEKPGRIKGVITLNSPLAGLSYERLDIFASFHPNWGSPAVTQLTAEHQLRSDSDIAEQKKEAARRMAGAGVHLATFGTRQDSIVNPLLANLTDGQGYPLTKGHIVSADLLSVFRDLFSHFDILYNERVADYIVQVYCCPSNGTGT